MTALWIGLYALGMAVSVPFIARWAYEPNSGDWMNNDKTTCVIVAMFISLIWPALLFGWLVYRLATVLTPWIFPKGR